MKKTLAIIALSSAVAASTFGQGFVVFANTSAASTKISTNSVVGGAATGLTLGAGNFYYALFYSVAATTVSGSAAAVTGTGNYVFNDSNWALATSSYATSQGFNGAYASSTSSAGRLTSLVADPNNSSQTGVPSSANQQFVILGWSASIGTTLQAVTAWYNNGNPSTAGWIGESAVSGTVTPSAGGLSSPSQLFGSGLAQGFTLGEVVPTPEPTTLALAALGGASLLMFRRKK